MTKEVLPDIPKHCSSVTSDLTQTHGWHTQTEPMTTARQQNCGAAQSGKNVELPRRRMELWLDTCVTPTDVTRHCMKSERMLNC